MSTLTNPTANHASKIVDKHLIVQGKLIARNVFTENEWKAYTPTLVAGGTMPTSATISARWRLTGSTVHVIFSFTDTAATGGASTGGYTFSFPDGCVLSAAKLGLACGNCYITEAAGSTTLLGVVLVGGTTTPVFFMFAGTELVAPVQWGNSAPAGTRLSTATNKTVTCSFSVEIEPSSRLLTVQNN